MGTRYLLSFLEHQFERWGCGMGPRCSLCGTFTGPSVRSRPVHGTDLHPVPGGPPRPAGHPARPPRPRPALGAVGLPDRGLRPLGPRPLGPGGGHLGRTPGLDDHLRAAAAVSEPAPAGRVPPQRTAGELTCRSTGGPGRLPRSRRGSGPDRRGRQSGGPTKPKAARRRRRAASCSGSTSAMVRAGYRRRGSSRRAPRCR